MVWLELLNLISKEYLNLYGSETIKNSYFYCNFTNSHETKIKNGSRNVIEQAIKAVTLARNLTDDVEFSPEDAGRSDIDFLCKILESVIKCGAKTINIPDTVGYTMPEQFYNLIHDLISKIPNSDKVIWSVHCHNDLGLLLQIR